jgi:ferredoxin-NADP reductase
MTMDTHPVVYTTHTVSLTLRRHEYGEVYTYVFSSTEPVPFSAGQYVHMRLLSLPEDVRRVREFSFASAPHEASILFGIDARSGSPYQEALKALSIGDSVELFKIKGHMTWPPTTREVVMIGGGIGVTPFRSMLQDAEHKSLSIESTLLHVSRDSYLYEAELGELAHTYTQIGRMELIENLRALSEEKPAAQYYVAGSPQFVTTVMEELGGMGITNIESDPFKGLEEEE